MPCFHEIMRFQSSSETALASGRVVGREGLFLMVLRRLKQEGMFQKRHGRN